VYPEWGIHHRAAARHPSGGSLHNLLSNGPTAAASLGNASVTDEQGKTTPGFSFDFIGLLLTTLFLALLLLVVMILAALQFNDTIQSDTTGQN
jgi:hypothetical protein